MGDADEGRRGPELVQFLLDPPQKSLTMASAQATIRLPTARYLVSTQVKWGYVKVGVPQSATSSRHVTAHLTSSELELLP